MLRYCLLLVASFAKVSNTAHGLFHPKCTEIQKIKFEIYVKISTGTTISQEMLKQTVNNNNIHVPVGVSQVSQLLLVVMILLINDCYVMTLVVIISRMNFVLYRKNESKMAFLVCLFKLSLAKATNMKLKAVFVSVLQIQSTGE